MKYELCYLVGESNEPILEQIDKEIKGIITEVGGKFEEPKIIEKRKVAYSIKKEIRGLYITQRFETDNSDAIEQTTKKINLNRNILRFIIVKADGLPKMEVYKKYAPGEEEAKEKPLKKEEVKKEEVKKEEVKKEEVKKEEPTEKTTEKKEAKKEESKPVKKKNVKKSIPSDDEIDKTLEEILNI